MDSFKFLECKECGHPNDLVPNVMSSDGKYYHKKHFPHRKKVISCCECESTNIKLVNWGDVDLQSICLGKFQMKTPAEKKAMLKARSQEHFKKKIKGFKDHTIHG